MGNFTSEFRAFGFFDPHHFEADYFALDRG
jgi:hypothetical protein